MVVLIDTSIAREQIMLRLLGRGSQLCDKLTRREVLQAGAISALGHRVVGVSNGAAQETVPSGCAPGRDRHGGR